LNHRLADELAWFAKSKGSAMKIQKEDILSVVPAPPGRWTVAADFGAGPETEQIIAWLICTDKYGDINAYPVTPAGFHPTYAEHESQILFDGAPQAR
jgi:hypothetical protein